MTVRTQIFEYNDKKRINSSAKKHNVKAAENGKNVALIGEANDVYAVLDSCFGQGNYHCRLDGDILLVNL